MNAFRLSFVPALLAFCFVLLLGAGHAEAGAKKPKPPPDKRKMVNSVDAKTNSIVIVAMYHHAAHTYKIDNMTAIQVDGASAKFSDIKAGMEVTAYTERDNDDLDSVALLSTTHAPTIADKNATPEADEAKKIQSVDPSNNSVVILFVHSSILRTYHIDATTALKVNGVAGSIGDLKAGMDVMDYTERDNDDLDALTAGGYPTDTKPAAKPGAKPAH